jgi:phage recombination protein Bet
VNELATQAPGALVLPESDMLLVLQSSLYPGASFDSIKMVLGYCKAAGLDPMQKPVHIVPMWDSKSSRMRDVVMPGVGMYRTQASRSGAFAGVTEPEFGPDTSDVIGGQEIMFPAWCRVTVKRRLPTGEIASFTAREFWRENYAVKGGKEKSVAPNAMWTKRPYGQIAKCAQAQALRLAFPELGSAPAAEEMEGKTLDAGYVEVETAAAPAPPAAPAAYPGDKFEQALPIWRGLIADGKKTPDQIIATVQTKHTLSAEQVAAIRAPVKAKVVDDDGVIDADFVAGMERGEAAQNEEGS